MGLKKEKVFFVSIKNDIEDSKIVLKVFQDTVGKFILAEGDHGIYDLKDLKEAIKEIEKALSLNNRASADTAMRKLQSLTRNNVYTNY